ncbi:TetR/AcrR family transcriptional regulator [Saccharopolyspora sp. HNM0983]|uniref:TetR/AcrR family transcriptional regulator n=2 Tax=Saccharopolyspora montiporae TaxID=2781240 RepID=A0A929FWJ8_9PSEU|nr:TetR-like C-terminal domain-containing protein [Saccharopolyspora sp. HNM0983]MBE9373611.1 TetR/AcrR family transcriptional regulator [Saccharopolyspora sp. HNM0983]
MDRRTRRTRSALENALLQLITEHDLNQISVSDVAGSADVHRSTFYEHYTDVPDLAAAACTEMFDQLISGVRELSAGGGPSADVAHAALTGVFRHVAEHARLYTALLGDDGSARVMNYLLTRMTTSTRAGLAERGGTGDSAAPVPPFIAGALLATIIDWLRGGCPGSPEELSTAIWPHLLAAASAEPGDR